MGGAFISCLSIFSLRSTIGEIGRHAMNTINRISGYDPETDICWQFRNPGDPWPMYCKGPACTAPRSERRESAWFGRCRSGNRWFWAANASRLIFDGHDAVFGWEDSEEAATAAAMAAVCDFRRSIDVPLVAT